MQRIDWNKRWKEDYLKHSHADDLDFWNNYAPRFRKKLKEGDDMYVDQFYEFSEFEPGDTIFDMGCASGTLAIPFALRGHEIFAADFSPEMLKVLMEGAEEAGVADRIHPIRLDWNEDWTLRDDLPVCDVAISSRSLIVDDLTDALKKLESVARRKVCIGAWDTPTVGYDRIVAKVIGYERPGYGCHVYVINELMDRDLMPEMRYIKSPFRLSKFKSVEEATQIMLDSFQFGLTDEQEEMLMEYIDGHLKYHDEGDRQYWKFDHTEMSTIAHISWEVEQVKQK